MTFLSARRLRTTGNSTNNRLSYRLFFVNNSSAILLEMFPLDTDQKCNSVRWIRSFWSGLPSSTK